MIGKTLYTVVRNIFFAGLVSSVLLSCAKDRIEVADSGKTMFCYVPDNAQDKLSVGEKTGSVYPLIWDSEDRIEVVNVSTGSSYGFASLVSGENTGSATFLLNRTIPRGARIRIYYHSKNGTFVSGAQTREVGSSSLSGMYSCSDVVTQGKGGAPVSFSLNHKLCALKITLDTDADYSDWSLKALRIYTEASPLSGSFSYDDQNDALAVTGGNTQIVCNLQKPCPLTSSPVVWMVSLPVSSPTDFYLAADLCKGAENLTLYQQESGKLLPASKAVNVVFRGTLQSNPLPDTPSYESLTSSYHPRLLLSDGEMLSLKSQVQAGSNSYLSSVHSIIMSSAAAINPSDVLEYSSSSDAFFSMARNAMRRILYSAYAYRYSGEERYLNQAKLDLLTVCGFPAWDQSSSLSFGEMSLGVALGYDWLYGSLSESEKETIRNALNNNALCYAGTSYHVGANGITNRGQVSWSGLITAVLATYEDNPTYRWIIDSGVTANKRAVTTIYEPEGGYAEGYLYWNYGTIFQCVLVDALKTSTGKEYGYCDISGFRNTPDFINFMAGPSEQVFNFSDSPALFRCRSALWYFAYRFNNPSCLFSEIGKIGQYGSNKSNPESRLLPVVAAWMSKSCVSDVSTQMRNLFCTTRDETQVYIYRSNWLGSDAVWLATEGGKPSHSHGHMDGGSFCFDAFGVRWASDLGNETYADVVGAWSALDGYDFWDMTQNSKRWELLRYHPRNHNCFTINGAKHNANGIARITDSGTIVENSTEYHYVVFNMDDVYTPDGAERRYHSSSRTIMVSDSGELIIRDRIEAIEGTTTNSLVFSLVTPASVAKEGSCLVLTNSGKTMYLTASASEGNVTLPTVFSGKVTNANRKQNGFLISNDANVSDQDTDPEENIINIRFAAFSSGVRNYEVRLSPQNQ